MTALTNFGVAKSVRLAFEDIHIKQNLSDIFCHTIVNEGNDNDWIEDDNGVKYSKDGKKLIRGMEKTFL